MSETVREPGETAVVAAGQEESEVTPPGQGTGILRVFGRQMKLCRIRAGMERPEVGARTGYSPSTIAAYEQGRRIPPPRFIDVVDDLLDAGGLLKAMKEEVARAQYPAFFRDAARLEAEAVEVQIYANQAVPGLLQTEEYMRAVFGMGRPLLDEEVIEQQVTARLARQSLFSRKSAPLLGFVIDESVVRRPFGGATVLRGQLEHLLLAGALRNVEVQIMPLDREDNAAVDGPFTVLHREGGEQVAYLEAQGRSTIVTEPTEVRGIVARYGIIRAQALTPRESLAFIEKSLGEM
ncbi:helix-turn-helix domain-containing protein [Streptomyces sp. NRRL S-37]|uniref:helix-turn-helix domain-containing protein n=1 Tax=Streptomyces sp. NRRL S-37 TaxID=1463903 RepID=UPI00099D720B|nr:helix-turn-helix transcriptional regulator [Streptomyces sp. NRRL S-37]